jgi:small conductance mechanosensitive channel
MQYLQGVSEGVKAVKKAFDENDIVIPFPIRTLDFGIKGGQKLEESLAEHSENQNQEK